MSKWTKGEKIAVGVGAAVMLGLLYGAARSDERERLARKARQYVMSAVVRVAAVLGVPVPQVSFTECANASTDGNSICFNTDWAISEMQASCTDVACVFNRVLAIVAHEFGHIVDVHLRTGHPWNDELRADRVAGWCLAMLGVSPADFIALLQTWPASPTHPAGNMRIPAVVEGFDAAMRQLAAAL